MKRIALALFLFCLLVTPPAMAADKPAADAAPAAESKAIAAPVAAPVAEPGEGPNGNVVMPAATPAPEAAPAAPSFETPVTDPALRSKIEEMAKAHQHYANDFGFKKFAFGNIAADGNSYTLKFLADGDTLTTWTTMMAMTVYVLPPDPVAARGHMSKAIAMLEAQYKRFAVIITDQKFTDTHDDPMLFFEFMLKAEQAIYTSADFMRTGKDTAAFIQFSSRGKPVSNEMSVKMKEIVFLEAK
ncbi:MAG: hypothetical protein ACAH83_01815 [Alphaproteobacteria bacterium]